MRPKGVNDREHILKGKVGKSKILTHNDIAMSERAQPSCRRGCECYISGRAELAVGLMSLLEAVPSSSIRVSIRQIKHSHLELPHPRNGNHHATLKNQFMLVAFRAFSSMRRDRDQCTNGSPSLCWHVCSCYPMMTALLCIKLIQTWLSGKR